MRNEMKNMMMTIVMVAVLFAGTASAQNLPAEQRFDQTDGILAGALAIEDIEYKIMVQRATQTAIYYMPAAGMVDFLKESAVIWAETSTTWPISTHRWGLTTAS